MKNAMQLKSKVKTLSQEWDIPAQVVLQTYFSERLLARVAQSNYQSALVIKGGFLIASVIGHNSRATMDLDATLQGKVLDVDMIQLMFDDILSLKASDSVIFETIGIKEIRESDGYSAFRVSLVARYETIANPFHVDITSGDKITPKAVEYEHQPLFGSEPIAVLAYPIETILSEKIETILSRVDQNTRARDFYDVYVLARQRMNYVRPSNLKAALLATLESRGTEEVLDSVPERLGTIAGSDALRNYWNAYCSEYPYARDIDFDSTLHALSEMLQVSGLLE